MLRGGSGFSRGAFWIWEGNLVVGEFLNVNFGRDWFVCWCGEVFIGIAD